MYSSLDKITDTEGTIILYIYTIVGNQVIELDDFARRQYLEQSTRACGCV
jgi:hypothetical protein